MATAAPTPRRTPAQLASEGFTALVASLGMADAVRFVQLYDPGHGDYTRDRGQWLAGLTHAEVVGLLDRVQTAGTADERS